MMQVVSGHLQRTSLAQHQRFWASWVTSAAASSPSSTRPPPSRSHPLPVQSTSCLYTALAAPAASCCTALRSSEFSPRSREVCAMSAAAASASAGPASGQSDVIAANCLDGAPVTAHVLAVCRTAEDAERVAAVAREIASDATSAASLAIHMAPNAANLPPYAQPAIDVVGVGQRLASYGTRMMGRVLLAAASLGSTQELLRTHGSALGDGVVAVADRQTSGKGRGGNQWTSPQGCLMFSALRRLRVQSPAQAPFINYLVCLAITRGVNLALKESQLPSLDIRIKWPNDIYADGVKIGGALIHTTWQGGCFNVVVGIGLNVNNRIPTTCLDELLEKKVAAATAAVADPAAAAGGGPPSVSRETVLAGVLASLEEVYDTFEHRGFVSLEPEYLATWLHSGQVLDFLDPTDGATAPEPSFATAVGSSLGGGGASDGGGRLTRLTILGLSSSGFLLAEDGAGGRYELTPDGNSLDMMRGLIRRKVN